MQELVLAEIENSTRMIQFCEADSRLGFHPEAEGYKYFPEKLLWRIELLKDLLDNDFPQVEKRLISGKKAFVEKASKFYSCNSAKYEYIADFAWKATYSDEKLKVIIDNFDKQKGDEFRIFLETKAFNPPQDITINGKDEISIPLVTQANEVGFNIIKINKLDSNDEYSGWENFHPLTYRLVLGDYNPQAKGKLILNNTKPKGGTLKSKAGNNTDLVVY
jgi:hypothetical protein